MLGDTGTINLTDPKITGLANTFYSDTVGWIIAAVVIGAYAAVALLGHRRRVARRARRPRASPRSIIRIVRRRGGR